MSTSRDIGVLSRRLTAHLREYGLFRVAFDPTKAWAEDINENGRYTAKVEQVTVLPGNTAKATQDTWDDGAPVSKKFKRSRRRPIPPGRHKAVIVNDGAVYIFDGQWWYQSDETVIGD